VRPELVAELEACRRAEKEQALFYRRLASDAELRDDVDLAQRFHDLHADEQHHLSRLTARLVETGHSAADLGDLRFGEVEAAGWEEVARGREEAEIRRYEALLAGELDEHTRALAEQILEVERNHARELGGKWTMA
jgi:rubrerythrin